MAQGIILAIIGIFLALEGLFISVKQKEARKALIKIAKSKNILTYGLIEFLLGLIILIIAITIRKS